MRINQMYGLPTQQLYPGLGCYLATHEAAYTFSLRTFCSQRFAEFLPTKTVRVRKNKREKNETNEQRPEKTQSPCVSPRTAQPDWRSLSSPLRLADSYIVQQEITIY